MTTLIERLAGWATDLDLGDIPDDVQELCDAQRQSVRAGIAASSGDAAYRKIASAIDDSLYRDACASMALDFDDYLCFGHTGHSAVLVTQHIGDEAGANDHERLTAQTVANEIGARLGGACLVGPLNGQLWSFIHAVGAAAAAARLLGLDASRAAHALAISLTNAPRPTVPGFMAPDTKLLTAAEPIQAGVRAARLAAAGVTGPLDVLDHPQGFLEGFAYVPLRSMLGGLGTGWATKTLCIKPYPGCAYLDTTLDALADIGPLDATAIKRVIVHGGALTCGMDELSANYAHDDPSPVTVTFSIPWNVAIMLTAGRLTAAEVNQTWLATHRSELESLRHRVELRHDWDATLRTARAFAPLLHLAALAREAGPRTWLGGLRRVRREHRSVSLDVAGVAKVAKLIATGRVPIDRGPSRPWDPEALESFRMTFPARVEIIFADGRREEATADIPQGAAGHPRIGPAEIAAQKAPQKAKGPGQDAPNT
ncbi:MmgE/PrpD family protein [Mycobacterium spongiae]|uniref:MmgE/PrpD N-terminal domain-containing protein n=1 Tax=Mycobacterium spongiae TaxID=886343 RepID=A0A975PX62_9MYCO|nr:MmgE/PrpD family protein [Mycobacterium spongiae]QUR67767.1 hypothetical protein F6B93_12235 [Mycobacterium spongiae]